MGTAFKGEYSHSIDAKGRLIIPAKFRELLGEQFVVTKGFDGCLFVFAQDGWDQFEEKLQALPMDKPEARMLGRFFIAGAIDAEVDKQGRILLPPVLRNHAGLDKDVMIIGTGSRVEIWDLDRWNKYNSDISESQVLEIMSMYDI